MTEANDGSEVGPVSLAAFRSQFADTGLNWESEPEVAGWEAWNVAVRVGRMPDGSLAITGLRIDPRDDYDGSIRDQRITAVRLRSLPLGYLLSDAAAKNALLRGDDYEAFRAFNQESLIAEVRHRIAEAIADRAKDVGREQARLEMVAVVYRNALAANEPLRASVADALNVSLTTVDRLLARARRNGLLAPHESSRARNGKGVPTPEGKS